MGEDTSMANRQVKKKKQLGPDVRPLPTVEELQVLFDEYNKLYFWGKLGKCEFHFFPKNNSNAGWYNHKRLRNGKIRSQIWLGKCVMWTDQVLKEVLVHEMIHMYNRTIESDRRDGLLGHGRRFRRQCRRLMKEHGLKIYLHGGYEFIDDRPEPALWEKVALWIIDR